MPINFRECEALNWNLWDFNQSKNIFRWRKLFVIEYNGNKLVSLRGHIDKKITSRSHELLSITVDVAFIFYLKAIKNWIYDNDKMHYSRALVITIMNYSRLSVLSMSGRLCRMLSRSTSSFLQLLNFYYHKSSTEASKQRNNFIS